MRLSAVDCVQRGVASLRANWELVLVQLLQQILVGGIALAGLVPPLAVVGFGLVGAIGEFEASNPLAWGRFLGPWLDALAANVPALVAAGVATLLIWLAAFLVYCYFQGGIYGVLVAADRQAPPGAGGRSEWFRTYRFQDVRGWGARYLWRFFAFWNLVLALASLWLAVTVAWIALAVWGWKSWGGGAGIGIGCGGALPVVFGWVALGLWTNLASAALAEEDAGVVPASRLGLAVLGRRLGGVLLILLVFVAAAMAVGIVFAPLSLAFDFVLREQGAASLLAGAILTVAQSLISSLVGIGLVASLVALMRSERAADGTAA